MAQRTQNSKPLATRQRKAEPLWLWFALIIGSGVIHSLLAIVVIPLLHQWFTSESEIISAVPIQLIDLPQTAASSAQTKSPPNLAPIAAPPNSTSSPAAINNVTRTAAASSPSPAQSVVPDRSSPGFSPSAESESNRTDVTMPNRTPQPDRAIANPGAGEVNSSPATRSSPQSDAAETPGFTTIPIDVPTPDVSQTLPSPSASPLPSPLAQVEVNQDNTPVNLTVHLTFERLPIEKAGDEPDRLAVPAGGIESREISTVQESACAGALKPEIMQSLGVKVGLQVNTDASGEVLQIAAQVPSRNPAYNELARCLVQHWEFVPAEEAGEPVASNALLVWVTIERT